MTSQPPVPAPLVLPATLAQLAAALWPEPVHQGEVAVAVVGTPTSNHNGLKQVLELRAGGDCRTIFFKLLAPGISEAAQYRALARAGVPVARLIAAGVERAVEPGGEQGGEQEVEQEREWIALEHLATIGIPRGDEAAFGEYIDCLARLQAAQIPELRSASPRWLSEWLQALAEAWQVARSGSWGPALQDAAAGLDQAWPCITGLAEGLAEQLNRLPWLPTHHDPAYGNIGRALSGGPLVLFDLQYCNRFPLGRDLMLALGGFAQAWPHAGGQERWIARFVSTYQQTAVTPITQEELTSAIALHRAAYICWFDRLTLRAAQRACERDPGAFAGGRWGIWLASKWSTLLRWADAGRINMVDQR